MHPRTAALLVCLGVLLPACDWGRRYVGMGEVVAVDAAALQVSIRHDAIPGLMDAATTPFRLESEDLASGLVPGARVRFVLRRSGGALLLTRATPVDAGNPGLHDHTPHHGGVVAMAGMIHLEATASPDGRLTVYLTDLWRRPLPLDEVEGTVTVDLADGKRALPLLREDGALSATTAPLAGATVNARFELRRQGEPVEVSFLLPLSRRTTGAAGIPAGGCAPVTPGGAEGSVPRCTLSFARPVVALAATPDAATLLVSMVDLGISAWRLPAVEFAVGFAPPPPVRIPIPEPPHPEAPNAVVARPDGREVAVAMENRLIVYATDTGQVLRAFDGPGGIVRALSWSPDGRMLLMSAFYTAAGFLLDATDGRVLRRIAVEREGAAVAFAADGRRIAVASENGQIVLVDLISSSAPLVLRGGPATVRGMAFAGEALVAVSEDGMLRIFDAASGSTVFERQVDTAVRAVAFDVARGVVATAGLEPRIHVTPFADGPPLAVLEGHGAQILSLTWAGPRLVSGDAAGRVALWDVR